MIQPVVVVLSVGIGLGTFIYQWRTGASRFLSAGLGLGSAVVALTLGVALGVH